MRYIRIPTCPSVEAAEAWAEREGAEVVKLTTSAQGLVTGWATFDWGSWS